MIDSDTLREIFATIPGVHVPPDGRSPIVFGDIHTLGTDEWMARTDVFNGASFVLPHGPHRAYVNLGTDDLAAHHDHDADAPVAKQYEVEGEPFVAVDAAGVSVFLSVEHALLLAASILRANGTPDMSVEDPEDMRQDMTA